MNYYLYSNDLIGDTFMQTPALRALGQSGKAKNIFYVTPLDSLNRIVLANDPYITEFLEPSPEVEAMPGKHIKLQAMAAYNIGHQHQITMAHGFGILMGVQVHDISYHYTSTAEEREAGKARLKALTDKPAVLVARHSYSCTSHDPKYNNVANITLPNKIWVDVANWLLNEGYMPIAIGSKDHGDDPRYEEWPGIKAYGVPLRELAMMMRSAKAVLSVNTGMRHLAGAVGAHLYCPVGTTPMWLVNIAPKNSFQRIYEEQVNVLTVDSATVINGAQKVLNG